MGIRRPALFARQAVTAFEFGPEHQLETYANGWKVVFTADATLTAVLTGGKDREYPLRAGDELVSVGDDVYLKLGTASEPEPEPHPKPDPERDPVEPERDINGTRDDDGRDVARRDERPKREVARRERPEPAPGRKGADADGPNGPTPRQTARRGKKG